MFQVKRSRQLVRRNVSCFLLWPGLQAKSWQCDKYKKRFEMLPNWQLASHRQRRIRDLEARGGRLEMQISDNLSEVLHFHSRCLVPHSIENHCLLVACEMRLRFYSCPMVWCCLLLYIPQSRVLPGLWIPAIGRSLKLSSSGALPSAKVDKHGSACAALRLMPALWATSNSESWSWKGSVLDCL